MNDVTPPPRGKLPRPSERPNVRMQGVRSAPQPVVPERTKQVPTEPDPSQPLALPQAETPQQIVFPRQGRRWLKWLLIIVAVLVVLLAIAGFVGYSWYQDALQARSNSSESIKITVESGETADAVATKLEEKGVIKSAFATQIYVKLNGKGNIKAGSYLFSPNQTPSEIIQWLNDGRVDTFKVTIVPGQTLAEIKKELQKYEYAAQEIDAAFAKQYEHPLLADKPANATLEGYIYPETYFVTSDTSVEQLLTASFDEFEKQITAKNLRATVKQRGFNLFQGIILASIIEKEVTKEPDQRQVAQVFEKRLNDGMALGSDVTYHFAAELLGIAPNPNIDSPYNTRKFPGLPPGPIANFHLSALEAVGNPASGDYLFFVAGDDGVTYFARTNAEHDANVQKHCQKLCSTF
jgi:UPF0755 protein